MVVNDRLEDAVDALVAIVQARVWTRHLSTNGGGPLLAHWKLHAEELQGTLEEEPANAERKTQALISPRIDKLLEHVDSDYASVVVAARRARQINSYYHNLGEGTFIDEFPPPMVETLLQELPDDRARRRSLRAS